jgi:hypothetical protein
MALGTIYGSSEARAWAILIGMIAACLGVIYAIQQAAESVKGYIKQYAFQVFEDGFKSGVNTGREMEAAGQFIASVTDRK